MNKVYVVTVVDSGDTCDGKARTLKICKTRAEAVDFVNDDIREFCKANTEYGAAGSETTMSAWFEGRDSGAEWNIEEVDFPA